MKGQVHDTRQTQRPDADLLERLVSALSAVLDYYVDVDSAFTDERERVILSDVESVLEEARSRQAPSD